MYIYIYIYICVCVCVCVCIYIIYIYKYIYIYIYLGIYFYFYVGSYLENAPKPMRPDKRDAPFAGEGVQAPVGTILRVSRL